ncbi:MAG: 4-phosphoerythronate dehydrogenase [Gammaproteobacteria bacterium]|nr:4-phosphoerythronate dehydrogenase [Gammaproteobacteria bacterium]
MKLVIDDACFAYESIFSEFGEVRAIPGRDINKKSIKDADVLIVRSRTKVDKELLDGSSIKFVGSTVAGLDHIDQRYLKENNVAFFSAQGCNSMAVAEFVICACVNLAEDFNFKLKNKTLGIIGVGNVGSRLAKKAENMGIRTFLNDPPRQERENLPHFVDLNTALNADIVTFHTPLTKNGKHKTYHLLNENNFSCINDKTILFNAARGGVIDENIWQKNKTLANVIDCWENEPKINSVLQNSAYWATPHIAGHSIDAKFMGSYMIYEKLCSFLNKDPDKSVNSLVSTKTMVINKNSLKEVLNTIYPFSQDSYAIKDINNFEDYRRNYPERYQWQHYKANFKLP